MGQDLAGPGLQGRDRVPGARRPRRVPRRARLQPRRLRLHHVHRQQRAAARGDLRRGRRRGPGGGLGAVGQPQLRGPDQPRREDELPGLAAAVRGLRAGRDDGHRPLRRAAGRGQGRRAGVPQGHLARRQHEVAQTVEEAVQSDMFRKSYGEVFDGDERWNSLEIPSRRELRLGRGLHLRPQAAVLRRHAHRARCR